MAWQPHLSCALIDHRLTMKQGKFADDLASGLTKSILSRYWIRAVCYERIASDNNKRAIEDDEKSCTTGHVCQTWLNKYCSMKDTLRSLAKANSI